MLTATSGGDGGGEPTATAKCFAGIDGQPYCQQHAAEVKFEVCAACYGPLQDNDAIIKVRKASGEGGGGGKGRGGGGGDDGDDDAGTRQPAVDLYHELCLNCQLCGDNLRGRPYFVEAGVIYCERDFLARFSK